MGGIGFLGGTFLPCRIDECKQEEKSMDFGIEEVQGKRERIVVRKLKGKAGH